MRYQNVRLKDLTTPEQMTDAIDAIERNPNNSDGDWYSGRETWLKAGAQKVIDNIWKRFDRLFPEDENEG